jgi:hypothetical protein
VLLCNKKIGNQKTTCFERFHQLNDLSQLVREKNHHKGLIDEASRRGSQVIMMIISSVLEILKKY